MEGMHRCRTTCPSLGDDTRSTVRQTAIRPFLISFVRTIDCLTISSCQLWVEAVLIINAGISMLWVSHAHPRAIQASVAKWPNLPESLVGRYFAGLLPAWDRLWSMRKDLLSQKNTLHPGRSAVLIVFAHSTVVLHSHLYQSVSDVLVVVRRNSQ